MKLLLIPIFVASLCLVATLCWAAQTKERPIDTEIPAGLAKCDPKSEIHIHNQTEAKAVRQSIIKYLWADGSLPLEKQPAASPVPLTPELKKTLEIRVQESWVRSPTESITTALVSRVEKLVVTMDFDFHSTAYLLYPAKAAAGGARLLIIHQGHQGGVMDGTGVLANRALAEGFQVLLMQMPAAGWNETENVLNTPKGRVTIDWRGSILDCHTRLVDGLEGQGGSALRFYIEPVIVCINYFVSQNPKHGMIAMAGLSGGGWTTDIAPAIDARIVVSIPVAGSYPWYFSQRPPGAKHGGGDGEQGLMAMYDKTASYMDLYILSGYGNGRKRIQVFPEFDPLSAPGVANYRTYTPVLQAVMKCLGGGECDVVVDKNEKIHRISPWTIENVIMPAILSPGQAKKSGAKRPSASASTRTESGSGR